MKKISLVLAAIFAFGALVQINDPDPFLWMVIYLAAATASFLEYRGTLHPALPIVIGVVALIWAADIGFDVFERVPFLEMFQEWEMRDDAVEESREVYGLLMIVAWMAVLGVRRIRLRREATAAAR